MSATYTAVQCREMAAHLRSRGCNPSGVCAAKLGCAMGVIENALHLPTIGQVHDYLSMRLEHLQKDAAAWVALLLAEDEERAKEWDRKAAEIEAKALEIERLADEVQEAAHG